jgi:carbonic anhydrase
VGACASEVGLSRRSFLGKGLAVSSAALVGGVAAACGDSKSSSSSASSTTSTTTVTNPDQALNNLLEGNRRYVSGNPEQPGRDNVRRAEQAEGQTPYAVILGCADSRVPPEIIFDEGIGDLFPVRVAGNTSPADVVLGTIEYGVAVLNCKVIMVLGHQQCGAVKAAIDKVTKGKDVPGHIGGVVDPIVPAVEAVKATPADQLLEAAIKENVRQTVSRLQSSQPILAPLVQSGKLKVVGAEYALHTGRVDLVA